jgi:hypothetical protein
MERPAFIGRWDRGLADLMGLGDRPFRGAGALCEGP